MARVVRDAECGIVVDSSNPSRLADAMEYLMTHPEEAARMGTNGRKAVEDRYNWEREVRGLLEFYLEIITPARKKRIVGQAFQPNSEPCQGGKPDLLPCRSNMNHGRD